MATHKAGEGRRLITILTTPDAQTQLMAMVLTMSAIAKGAQARILLCGPAGDIALKDAPESATAGQPPRGASPQGLMRQMIESGAAVVQVCALYLPGRGAAPSVLIDGVGVAAPGAMAAELMADDTVILSF